LSSLFKARLSGEASSVATYRLFMLHPEGHVRSATVLECADDAEAA